MELRGWELFWYRLACVLTLGGLYVQKLVIKRAMYEATHEYRWTPEERRAYLKTGEEPPHGRDMTP